MDVSNKNRIIFLDLMRAYAVLMMVQGHTVHTFLSEDLRTTESFFYSVWYFMRGFTAPVFMFTAGVAFTYLLLNNNILFKENPRVIKGFKRFLVLIIIGYLLRYPTHTFFDFSQVTYERWLMFFSVDALHLIGFGLLFILGLLYFAEKIQVRPIFILSLGALLFFLFYPFVAQVEWKNILSPPLAAYMYRDTGSLFPLFPWAGYVLSGAVLGAYLAHNTQVYARKGFGHSLILIGISLIGLFILESNLERLFAVGTMFEKTGLSIIFLRLGFVILLSGLISLLALRLNSIPKIIKLAGRYTLLIYIVHLIILYGWAWSPGFYNFIGKSFGLPATIGAVLIMYSLMFAMVFLLDKFKDARRKKLAALQTLMKF